MKLNIFRILAFAIDMVIINLILILVGMISFVTPDRKAVNDEYKVFSEVHNEYDKLTGRLDEILYDNYVDLLEISEIRSDYPYFKNAFNEIPVNSEFDSELKNTIKNKVDEIYNNKYYSYTYDANKCNMNVNIIGIVLSVIYFGFSEFLFNGRTLGKRIFRIRTLDNDKPKKRIVWWKNFVRAVFISEAFFYLINIVLLLITHSGFEGTLNARWYTKANGIIYTIQYVYNVVLLLFVLMRTDGRSVHDLVLNTRVALFDKKNKEIVEQKIDEEVIN